MSGLHLRLRNGKTWRPCRGRPGSGGWGLGKNGLRITVQCANVKCVFSANYLHIVGPRQAFDE